jgi:hypothetical protein
MIRKAPILLLCVLSIFHSHLSAHMLNMSDISLNLNDADIGEMVLRIDLGQSLMSAGDYWQAANQKSGSNQTVPLQQAISKLQQGVFIVASGYRVSLPRPEIKMRAATLEAIKNPLTPQMAELTFKLSLPEEIKSLEIRLSNDLEIPWPCLIRIDQPKKNLPISRLLTDGSRSTGVIDLSDHQGLLGNDPLTELAMSTQSWTPNLVWIAAGAQHIIPLGVDHILFILALFFLNMRLVPLIAQITVFTIAHSITLCLAALDIVHFPAGLIEPIIAASIVYMAINNLLTSQVAKHRLSIIFFFGLIHGMGFASALESLFPSDDWGLQTLFLFNVGIELGQITVLLIALSLFSWLRSNPKRKEQVFRFANLTIAGVGLYWFIQRVLI